MPNLFHYYNAIKKYFYHRLFESRGIFDSEVGSSFERELKVKTGILSAAQSLRLTFRNILDYKLHIKRCIDRDR